MESPPLDVSWLYGGSEVTKLGEILERQRDTWIPTEALARDIEALLTTAGIRAVRASSGYHPLAIEDRTVTWHGENWYRPIRRWFKENPSTVDYGPLLLQHPDAVLEVGLSQYSVVVGYFADIFPFLPIHHHQDLFVRVNMKLVDPNTKAVLGRSWRFNVQYYEGSLPQLRADDAREFKELFLRTAIPSATRALRDLRLLPPVDE